MTGETETCYGATFGWGSAVVEHEILTGMDRSAGRGSHIKKQISFHADTSIGLPRG